MVRIDEVIEIICDDASSAGRFVLWPGGIRMARQAPRHWFCSRRTASTRPVREDRTRLVVSEMPYQVNKAAMVERIAELWREKKIDGIAALRDESDREGYRVVIEIKRDALADIVLNQLYRYTPLQSTFGANVVALEGGRPQ